MDLTRDFIKGNKSYLAVGAVVVGATCFLYKRWRKRTRICGVDYPKDTVILHVFPGNKYIPNMGHFVMKLETYLRINKIPYQLDFNYQNGPKKKVPWIEYNGVTMGDSQLIIEYLNKQLNIDMNSHLSKQDRAVAWAVQKWLEEYTYWLNVFTRWIIGWDDMMRYVNATKLMALFYTIFMKRQAVKYLYTVGVGRHSNEEIQQMVVKDLKQFSEILGDKKFIMGETITETDCAAFGIISQIRWCTPENCPGHKLLQSDELKNVTAYLDRIKDTYWADWDDILAAAGKKGIKNNY